MQLSSLTGDLSASAKRIRRHPRYFLLLAVMLGVGIGSVTGIFDVAYRALYSNLPYRQVDRIVITNDALSNLLFSSYTYRPNPHLNSVFEDGARYVSLAANMNSDSGLPPTRIQLAMVSWRFFPTLGVRIPIGRDFSEAMQPIPNEQGIMPDWLPIILSDRLWRSQFGGNPNIVGHSIVLNMRPYRFQVIGVAPPGIDFPPGSQAWIPAHDFTGPLVQTPDEEMEWGVIGLLRPGLSLSAAEAQMRTWPQHTRWWFNWDEAKDERLTPFRKFLGGQLYRVESTLWLATIFFFILTVAAVLSVLQIEIEIRGAEFHIKRILGATPWLLFRSLLVETSLAVMLGLTLSLAVRSVLILSTASYFQLGRGFSSGMSWVDVAMVLAVAAAAFVAAAIAQARALGWLSISNQSEIRRQRVSRFRLPIQVIPATLILIAASMLVTSAYRLEHSDPGVQDHNAFICEVALRLDIDQPYQSIDLKLPQAERDKQWQIALREFTQRLTNDFTAILQRLKDQSAVSDAGAISISPYSGQEAGWTYAYYSRTTAKPPASSFIDHTMERSITPSAIAALGMKLTYGQDFTGNVGADRGMVLVNEVMAAQLGGRASAVGKYLRLGSPDLPPDRIVGIVNNVHEKDLYSAEEPTVYYPFSFRPVTDLDLVVRTWGNMPNEAVLHLIQTSVKAIAPDATVSHFSPLTNMVQSGTEWTKYSAYFLLALAAVGVFLAGVCAWAKAVSEIRRREHEIGVRLALGAVPGQILRLVLGTQVMLTAVAAGIGAILALWFAHLMSFLFFGAGASSVANYLIGIGMITSFVAIVGACSIKRTLRRSSRDLLSSEPL